MMTDTDLPSFFQAADQASLQGQQRYINQVRAHIAALVAAGLFGALAQLFGVWLGWFAGVAFVVAALLRLYAEHSRDDRIWYEGRAAAESAKTLAWRYAVGGRPLSLNMHTEEVREAYIAQLRAVASTVTHLPVTPSDKLTSEISPVMDSMRASALVDRTQLYRDDRLEGQRAWYAQKAKLHLKAHRFWQSVLIGVEVVGAVFAGLIAAGVLAVDLLGALSAAGSAILVWMSTKRYWDLATAYSVAAHELAQASALTRKAMSEEEWADFVDKSEEAISREHTLWTASRGILQR